MLPVVPVTRSMYSYHRTGCCVIMGGEVVAASRFTVACGFGTSLLLQTFFSCTCEIAIIRGGWCGLLDSSTPPCVVARSVSMKNRRAPTLIFS